MSHKFAGTGVALVTPFDHQRQVDFDGLKRLLDYTAGNGVNYYVVNGTTGESATTTSKEKAEILKFVKENNGAGLPVVYGWGGNNTGQLKKDLAGLDLDGVDALLSVGPYYNKPSQAGLVQHYVDLADESPLPIILYNVPGRTSSNIAAATTITLSNHSQIIGIKEASGDLEQCAEISRDAEPGFLLLSGDDMLTLPIVSVGGQGVISVLANGVPNIFTQMVDNCLDNQWSSAQQFLYKLLEINPLMYKESNPVGIKQLLREIGICGSQVRLPLVPATSELQDEIQRALDLLGVGKYGGMEQKIGELG